MVKLTPSQHDQIRAMWAARDDAKLTITSLADQFRVTPRRIAQIIAQTDQKSTVRTQREEEAFARLDAFHPNLPIDRLAGLAQTTNNTVTKWRRSRC